MNDSKLKGYSQINGEKVNIYIFFLILYSSYYFHFINYYLREKKVLQEKKKDDGILKEFSEDEILSWIKWLQKALIEYTIKDTTLIEENLIVYRAIKNHRFQNNYGVGSCFFNNEFWSTSKEKKFALDWLGNKGTLLEITITNNGINGYPKYCQYIETITVSKNQQEVLLAINCHFRVINIVRGKNIDYVSLRCEGLFI